MASVSHPSGAIPKSKPPPIQKEMDYMNNLTSKYLQALHTDIENNQSEQGKLATDINKIHEIMEQLEKLSERPEWPDSFVQVNPLAYVPAAIIHTGEHYVKLGPEMYTLMSLKETLGFLQRKIDRAQQILNMFKMQQKQLEERTKFSFDNVLEEAGTEGMPPEITSNKGVAHKTAAGFYEVIESYNKEDEQEFYKRRQEFTYRKGKQKKKAEETSDDYFARLDELQKQEESRGEFVDARPNYEMDTNNVEDDHINISDKVKMILRKSGVYNYLSEDKFIQQHCCEHKTFLEVGNNTSAALRNESVLNELIVEALINEPICLMNDDVSEDFNVDVYPDDSFQDISSNDMAASAFLDSIENNIKNWSL